MLFIILPIKIMQAGNNYKNPRNTIVLAGIPNITDNGF